MGTNFHLVADGNPCSSCGHRDPIEGEHVGKRSAAGVYCWDCNVSLYDGDVHSGHAKRLVRCPGCDADVEACLAAAEKSDELRGAAAVELGFAEPADERPRGIGTCSSFRWAMEPAEVRSFCEARIDAPAIIDEYGRTLTGGEFLRMLRCNCPIENFSIGKVFS